MRPIDLRFALAWTLPLGIGAAVWASPWAAWGALLTVQVALALAERIWRRSPPAAPRRAARMTNRPALAWPRARRRWG
jgi:hypothetical protein